MWREETGKSTRGVINSLYNDVLLIATATQRDTPYPSLQRTELKELTHFPYKPPLTDSPLPNTFALDTRHTGVEGMKHNS